MQAAIKIVARSGICLVTTHDGGEKTVADGGETSIASKPFPNRCVPDETEADGSERRTEHTARRGVEHSCCNHDDKDRPQCQYKGAHTDADDRRSGCASFRANGIDHRALVVIERVLRRCE